MRRRKKIANFLVASLLILVVVASMQIRPLMAYRKIHDADWLLTASPQEQRDTAHEALGFWFGDPHDVFLLLLYHGDQSSIPYLQRALYFAPKPSEGVVMCTWQHGREALARLNAENQSAPQ